MHAGDEDDMAKDISADHQLGREPHRKRGTKKVIVMSEKNLELYFNQKTGVGTEIEEAVRSPPRPAFIVRNHLTANQHISIATMNKPLV